MIPAIWLGNFTLVYLIKKIKVDMDKNYFLAALAGVLLKVAIILITFNILRVFGIFPDKMINNLQMAMGLTQLITATIGGLIGFGIYKFETRKTKE
jgi:hypothetical protein